MTTKNKTEGDVVGRMFAAGAHFAYSKSRRHPSVSPFIFGAKNHVEIFDLEETSKIFSAALDFIESLGKERAQMLLVGGKQEAKDAVRHAGERLGVPHVAGRWIGGTLTNYPQIKKRIDLMEKLISERESGELGKYTKLERVLIDRKIADLERNFGGIRNLLGRPAALLLIDTKREHIAVSEARRTGVPVIALMNSDCDIADADYPILGNDAGIASIQFTLNEVVEAYERGLKTADEKQPTTDNAAAAAA